MTYPIIMWFADRGAEAHLAVSLGSLRLAAPALWRNTVKLVVDCGLGEPMRSFLASTGREGVLVVPITAIDSYPDDEGVPGILPMRARTQAPRIVERLRNEGALPRWNACLVCDADTAFLREFEVPRPPQGADVLVMREWDCRDGVEYPMLLLRRSTFTVPLAELDLGRLSAALGLTADTLRDLPTYNTGVLAFGAGAGFGDAWSREYEALRTLRDKTGQPTFAAYAAEQNALSLSIHRGTIYAHPLPRYLNQFPPRPPASWPADTTIAHFISFRQNHPEARYRLWFQIRDRVRAAAWLPDSLVPTLEIPGAP